MKLLFDQNLSPVLVTKPADHYPGSVHAALVLNASVGTVSTAKTESECMTPFDQDL
jgi:hypothetical protein